MRFDTLTRFSTNVLFSRGVLRRKVKVDFAIEQAMKAQRRSRGIDLLFLLPRRYMGVCDLRHAPTVLPPVPIVLEAGRTLGPVWTNAENLAPTGIRFPDRRIRIESLYRVSYSVSTLKPEQSIKVFFTLTLHL